MKPDFLFFKEQEDVKKQIEQLETDGYIIVGKEEGFIIARSVVKDSKKESKETRR